MRNTHGNTKTQCVKHRKIKLLINRRCFDSWKERCKKTAEQIDDLERRIEAEPWSNEEIRQQLGELEWKRRIGTADLNNLRNNRISEYSLSRIARQIELDQVASEQERVPVIKTREDKMMRYTELKALTSSNVPGRTPEQARAQNEERSSLHYELFGVEEGVNPDWDPRAARQEEDLKFAQAKQRDRDIENARRAAIDAAQKASRPSSEQTAKGYETARERQREEEARARRDRVDRGF